MTETHDDDEMLLVRLRGGPLDGMMGGARRSVLGWPMPEYLPGDGGVYRKCNESQVRDQPAEYEWVPRTPA